MRTYELTLVVRPDLSEDNMAAALDQVQQWVKAEGNEVLSVEPWGRRRLAYPINDQREGYYYLMQLSLQPRSIAEIERNLKLREEFLRYMLIRGED
jgi:small subunit ribosomal protein S6